MPVADHLEKLNTQYLVSALRASHPSHACVSAPSGPRKMKETLQSKYQDKAAPYLANGVSVDADYCSNLKQIHSVAASISRLGTNDLLGCRPPPVSPSEGRLTRLQRTTLSQLRSGHCRFMQDYKVRVGQATSDVCLECRALPHTVQHLFSCNAAPTQITIRVLWINPVAVCDFLCSLSAFSALLPPGPAPPLRPFSSSSSPPSSSSTAALSRLPSDCPM